MARVGELDGDDTGVELELEEVEVALIESLARQMVDFIGPGDLSDEDPLAAMVGIDPGATTPEDPALRRLLPDAFLDDEDASGEFRRFTERDLRATKARHATRVLESLDGCGGRVRLVGDDLSAWIGFLNDARLTLGTRLGITEESHDELASLPDADPRAGLYQVYDWLTFLQESLVQQLLHES